MWKLTSQIKTFLYISILIFASFLQGGLSLVSAENDIRIVSHRGIFDGSWYWVFGEVENVGTENYMNVILKFIFYNATGDIIYSKNQIISLIYLLEKRRSPFSFVLTEIKVAKQVTSYEVKVESYEPLQNDRPCKLRITYHHPYNDSILGIIENAGSSETRFIIIYATFYDKDYSVIAIESYSISKLEPSGRSGDKSTFDIVFPKKFSSDFKSVKYYSLTAESKEYSIQEEVSYAKFKLNKEPEGGLDPIITTFIIVVLFSALVLVGAYLYAKTKQKISKRRIRKGRRRR